MNAPCPVCLTSNRVRVDELTRAAACGTCGETWTHTAPMLVGDVVRYAGPDHSVLDHGPGVVVELGATSARVRVTKGGTVLSNEIHAGEAYLFALKRLEVVRTAAGVDVATAAAPGSVSS